MNRLDELLYYAPEVSLWRHQGGEKPVRCEAWWRDGEGVRRVTLQIGRNAGDAVENTLREVKGKLWTHC